MASAATDAEVKHLLVRTSALQTAYTMMYRYTSAFAHGSDVNAHFFVRKESDVPTLKLAPGGDQIQPVLSSSISLLHDIAARLNETLGLGDDAAVERIAAEVLPQGRKYQGQARRE